MRILRWLRKSLRTHSDFSRPTGSASVTSTPAARKRCGHDERQKLLLPSASASNWQRTPRPAARISASSTASTRPVPSTI